jgi:N-acetylmuramoyl-L-alanine amidase
MRPIKQIFIHCSATPEGRNHTASDIDKWHKQRGFKGIGYHYVIGLTGNLEKGREESQVGAHAQGYNSNSIGICYIGGCDAFMRPKDTLTPSQSETLVKLLKELKVKYPSAKIMGHNQVDNKACPSFSVPEYLKKVGLWARQVRHRKRERWSVPTEALVRDIRRKERTKSFWRKKQNLWNKLKRRNNELVKKDMVKVEEQYTWLLYEAKNI